jgi:hypothetical protein
MDSLISRALSSSVILPTETPPEAQQELSETDVVEYIKEHKNNIILVFGQKVSCFSRDEIKKNIKKPETIFTGEDGKKYYQLIGRHLIEEEDFKPINSKSFSIFNISTLNNVVRVTGSNNLKQTRSVYSVEPYTLEEYEEILKK